MEDVAALVEPDIPRDLAYVGETLERVRAELGEDRALVGFAGAPFTLASYMVEGRGTRTFDRIKGLLRAHPDALVALLDRLADLVGDLLEFQLERGADAVQLFDSWAGELSPADYLQFAHPVNQRIAERIERAGGRLILFIRNGSHLFDTSLTTSVPALSLDWRIDLGTAAQEVAVGRSEGSTTVRCLQGNMDPADLFGPPACIQERVRAQHDAVAGKVGHIFNLGYGLVPTTPVEGIAAFVRSVQELGSAEPA
jgi:uroporphyrinogen decarboxylase